MQSTTVLASSALAPADLIAVAPGAIASATDSVPQISAARETVLHMADPASMIATVGTPGNIMSAPTSNLFQIDCIALRLKMSASWMKRDPRAVAWLSTTAW